MRPQEGVRGCSSRERKAGGQKSKTRRARDSWDQGWPRCPVPHSRLRPSPEGRPFAELRIAITEEGPGLGIVGCSGEPWRRTSPAGSPQLSHSSGLSLPTHSSSTPSHCSLGPWMPLGGGVSTQPQKENWILLSPSLQDSHPGKISDSWKGTVCKDNGVN